MAILTRLSPNSSLLTTPIAHRGLHSDAVPENSLPAFEWAIACGLPIECDVHLLADGALAVFHDFELARMTGDIRNLNEIGAGEAVRLRLNGSNETIPLLGDLLDLVHGKVPLLIELKEKIWSGNLEDFVVKALSHYSGEFAVQSFNLESILWLKNNAPEICRGQLSGGERGVQHYAATEPDFVADEIGSLPHADTTRLRNRGLPLLAWTISNTAEQARAAELADNYIFNWNEELHDSLGLAAMK